MLYLLPNNVQLFCNRGRRSFEGAPPGLEAQLRDKSHLHLGPWHAQHAAGCVRPRSCWIMSQTFTVQRITLQGVYFK